MIDAHLYHIEPHFFNLFNAYLHMSHGFFPSIRVSRWCTRMLENRFGDNFELKAERTEDGMNVVEICIPFDPVEVVLGESSIKIGEVSRK